MLLHPDVESGDPPPGYGMTVLCLEVGAPLGVGSSETFCFLVVESSHSTQEVSEWRRRRHETDPNL